jgi:hypothetical protein
MKNPKKVTFWGLAKMQFLTIFSYLFGAEKSQKIDFFADLAKSKG